MCLPVHSCCFNPITLCHLVTTKRRRRPLSRKSPATAEIALQRMPGTNARVSNLTPPFLSFVGHQSLPGDPDMPPARQRRAHAQTRAIEPQRTAQPLPAPARALGDDSALTERAQGGQDGAKTEASAELPRRSRARGSSRRVAGGDPASRAWR